MLTIAPPPRHCTWPTSASTNTAPAAGLAGTGSRREEGERRKWSMLLGLFLFVIAASTRPPVAPSPVDLPGPIPIAAVFQTTWNRIAVPVAKSDQGVGWHGTLSAATEWLVDRRTAVAVAADDGALFVAYANARRFAATSTWCGGKVLAQCTDSFCFA